LRLELLLQELRSVRQCAGVGQVVCGERRELRAEVADL
jgi:hypothetical protein